MNTVLTVRLALIMTCLSVFSCSTPTRYYMLDTLNMRNAPIQEPVNMEAKIIGLEPIKLPTYVDQIRIMRRTGSNTLAISPHDQWNEPLDTGVRRVIASNLTHLLPNTQVEYAPVPRNIHPDYGLAIEISRFDATADGAVLLEGEWSLIDTEGPGADKHQSFRFRVPSQGNTHADIAANMSNALTTLARDIAKALATGYRGSGRQL